MHSRLNRCVVRNGRRMVQLSELGNELGKAIVLANLVGVAVCSQGNGQLESAVHLPFVLEIQSQAVVGNGQIVGTGKSLVQLASASGTNDPVIEITHISDPDSAAGKRPCRKAADVVAAEIDAELDTMSAPGPGEVIHDLILSNVASLRIIVIGTTCIRQQRAAAETKGR